MSVRLPAVVLLASALVAGLSSGTNTLVYAAEAQPEAQSPAARVQSAVQSLITRLRGRRMPGGIVKSNGRIEATLVDGAAKYAGRLATMTVDEGDEVTAGQVVATISSPEYEAQLRGAQAQVLRAKQALAEAVALMAQRNSDLTFARADLDRGKSLLERGNITQQVVGQRRNRFEAAEAAYRAAVAHAIRPSSRSRPPTPTSSGSSRFWSISCSSRRGADACNTGSRAPARWSPRASAF